MSEVGEAAEIEAVLKAHEWTRYSRCECGWTMRQAVFPEPYINGADQYRAHVAEALQPIIANRERMTLLSAADDVVHGADLLPPPRGAHPAVTWLRNRAEDVRRG